MWREFEGDIPLCWVWKEVYRSACTTFGITSKPVMLDGRRHSVHYRWAERSRAHHQYPSLYSYNIVQLSSNTIPSACAALNTPSSPQLT